jgi:hypothetical protein
MEALARDAAFTELFDFVDKSVHQRNTLIVEMRVSTTTLAPETRAAIIDS